MFDLLLATLLGFAFAGLVASGFELLGRGPAGLRLLQAGDAGAFAAIPLLVFSAPLLLVRVTLRANGAGRHPATAALLLGAACWSLFCGQVLLDAAAMFLAA